MTDILNWGLIGGGEGSQIGFTHRAGSALDGRFRFVAGALDIDPSRGGRTASRSDSTPAGPMATGGRCWTPSASGTTDPFS